MDNPENNNPESDNHEGDNDTTKDNSKTTKLRTSSPNQVVQRDFESTNNSENSTYELEPLTEFKSSYEEQKTIMNIREGFNENIDNILGIPSRLVVPHTVPTLIKHFDFFNVLNEFGEGSLEDIALKFDFNERVLEGVLNYFVKEKFLEKRTAEDGFEKFRLSNMTKQFMVKDAPYDLSNFAFLLDGTSLMNTGESIASALRTGQASKWIKGNTWEEEMKLGSISEAFSQGMMCRGRYLADYLSKSLSEILQDKRKLIDVGGSLGDYCGALTRDFPNLECSVFDFPEVVRHAEKNILEKGYRRVSVIGGDMFADGFPKGYDTFLFSNVIHDWDPDQTRFLFEKAFDSLPSDGVVIVHDMHLNDDKISPSFVVDHSLHLSIFTDGRCYSKQEISSLLKKSGFDNILILDTVAGYSVIVGQKG